MATRRKYETTHPWMDFQLDLQHAPYTLWMLLGEAVSKCEHIAGVPLSPQYAQRLHAIDLARGVWATTAIEGNTLSEEEVKKRIEGKLPLPPSKEYLGQEVDNIVKALNLIARRLETDAFPLLSVDLIKQFNTSVLENLQVDPEVKPGEIREYSVGVAHYLGAPAEDCEYLLGKLCAWLNEPVFLPDSKNSMMYGILRAIIAHLYLAWIHPFGDGNGRTARLIEVQVLLATGVPSPAAHLLSNHYNLTRSVYYRQLDASSKSGVGILPFVQYALQGFVDGLKEQIHMIRDQQWEVAWRQFIFDKFPALSSETDKRRRDLALELTKATMKDYDEPIPLNKIRQISATVAQMYANKTYRTILRDIAILNELELVEITAKGVRAKREMILQFLPRRRDQTVPEPQAKDVGKTQSNG